jgi:hypothetical protein
MRSISRRSQQHRQQASPRQVRIVAPIDVVAHLLGAEAPIVAFQQPHRRPGVGGDAAALIQINVRQLVADHLVAGLGVHLDADLVGHGARRTEQRGLFIEQRRGGALQFIDRLVLAEDIVTHLRLQHRLQHGRSWLGDGIAAYVDHLRPLF